MIIFRESPWDNEIFDEGEIRGEIRGEIWGRLSSVETVLIAKFGASGLELMPQISLVSNLAQLDLILREIILTSSFTEIRQVILQLKKQV
jgi:predicted transposase YdaD